MTDLVEQLRQGGNLLVVGPAAVILGALHGLEPGHSKTMMAAFIVAVRGTVGQAVLLGLAATVSHTAVVWAVAMAGLWLGGNFSAETAEPYLQLAAGAIVVGIALRLFWIVKRGHSHACGHDHGHAHDIRCRFSNRRVTTGQIVLFGLTGGLIPCPAAATVLLLCLQLKKVTLGATLVLCFSVGLALTLVLSGVLAALSLKQLQKRRSGFGAVAGYAPYFSAALMTAVGLYMMWHGYSGLRAPVHH